MAGAVVSTVAVVTGEGEGTEAAAAIEGKRLEWMGGAVMEVAATAAEVVVGMAVMEAAATATVVAATATAVVATVTAVAATGTEGGWRW